MRMLKRMVMIILIELRSQKIIPPSLHPAYVLHWTGSAPVVLQHGATFCKNCIIQVITRWQVSGSSMCHRKIWKQFLASAMFLKKSLVPFPTEPQEGEEYIQNRLELGGKCAHGRWRQRTGCVSSGWAIWLYGKVFQEKSASLSKSCVIPALPPLVSLLWGRKSLKLSRNRKD